MYPSFSSKQKKFVPSTIFFTAIICILLITGWMLVKSRSKITSLVTNTPEAQVLNVPTVPEISPQELIQLRITTPLQIIDIRNPELFVLEHIQASINIPLEELSANIESIDKQKQIVIVEEIPSLEGKLLTEHFNNEGLSTKYLTGGLDQYRAEGFPLISIGDPESISDRSKTNPITALSLKQRLDKGERFIFLDVRSHEQFLQGHFDAALNIPLEDVEQKSDAVPMGKLVVMDENPVRSYQAAVKLYDMQYWGIMYLSDSMQTLKETLEKNEQPK